MYIFCIKLVYPYKNWGISAEDALSFFDKKGSEILVEEFPSSEDFIDTKEKLKNLKDYLEKNVVFSEYQS